MPAETTAQPHAVTARAIRARSRARLLSRRTFSRILPAGVALKQAEQSLACERPALIRATVASDFSAPHEAQTRCQRIRR